MTAALRIGFGLPFTEAIAAAKARGVVLPDVYYGKLQGIARAEAFSVAGIASLDQLDLIMQSLVKATSTGATFDTWRGELLDSDAALSLPAHRLDNIFRTNIQGAYARGRCVHIARNKDTRPFLLYSAINDSRTRPAHSAMDGFTAPVSDPIWMTWMPPNGFRCRCTVLSMTEERAHDRMRSDAERMEDADFANARHAAIINGPDKGWDYSPCAGLKLPAGVPVPKPGAAPHPALEQLSPGLVAAIRRPRHPALQAAADALLIGFLGMLAAVLSEDDGEEADHDA